MTLSPITPENTPRQVIPFGDRAIVDPATGRPTEAMYQWMNRVSGGLTTSITNISTTINETNTISETVNNISVDVTGIEAEIAVIDNTLGVLQGEIAAVQFDAGNTPTPPPPSIPAAALVQKIEAPPPPPRLPPADPAPPLAPVVARAVDYVELEAGSGPTKISALADLNLAGPPTGAEQLAGQSGGTANLGVALTTLYELFVNWLNYIATNPLTATVAATAGLSIQLRAGDGNTTGNGGSFSIRAGNGGGGGGDTGGTITITIGTGTANGNLVVANLPTSSAGLPADAVWCDTGAANVLKKV